MLYEESEPEDSRTDWVVLRVGGQVFETLKQTLCAEQSMLAAWVLRHRNNNDENRENSWVLRIDRDGQRFRHVLNYLRNGTVWLQDVASLRELLKEAEYFCLSCLQGLCEEKITNIEEADAAMWKRSVEALQDKIVNSIGSFEKFCAGCGNGEVYAVLRGRRLGCGDGEELEFRLDVDFEIGLRRISVVVSHLWKSLDVNMKGKAQTFFVMSKARVYSQGKLTVQVMLDRL